MNELPKMNSPLKHLDPNIDVSDSTLSSILVQLGYAVREANSIRFLLRDVELKYIIAKSKSKSHVYFVGFAFDPNCAGKLVRLTSRNISDIVTVVISSLALNSESTIILVGKKGSRKDNRFPFTCTPGALYNVVIREFTSQDNILSYSSNLLSDTDKIESRLARDPVRADMAIIQPSEKCIKIEPQLSPAETRTIIFANQLLQIPGMTEKLALALARTFETPIALIDARQNGATLKDFTFIDSRNVTKRINSRLLAVLEKLFDPDADPHSCIW